MLMFLPLTPSGVLAQETPESRLFKSAARLFETGVYDLAQRDFTIFTATYPQSAMLPEAILLQARSALYQTNLSQAVDLLSTNIARAGPLAEQYRYYLATAQLRAGSFDAAASFAQLRREFTNSVLLLEASHGEALARFRRREFEAVATLLSDPTGGFQRAASARPTDNLTVWGNLLLAEALLEERKFADAERVARALKEESLSPEYLWDRQNLLCRILLADQRPADALTQSTNLIRAAVGTTSQGLLADSFALQGQILEQLDQLEAASQVYTNNLAATVPANRRKMALLRLIEIKLAQDKTAEAAQMLDGFLATHPEDGASDVALLTLGELALKLHLAPDAADATNSVALAGGETNRLQQALGHFDRLLTTYTNSPLRGKATLNKGWCLWLQGNVADSALAFKGATELLPFSPDAAVARFKLADASFAQKDYTNALQNYRALTNEYSGVPQIRRELFGEALYQILRASIELNDLAGATNAMRVILDIDPVNPLGERSVLLVGHTLNQARQTTNAEALFNEFLTRFPDSALRPEVELAIARTHFLEQDWPGTIADYERWLARYPNHERRARAEFHRAWANDKAGNATNAFPLFTNFVAQFPTNPLAPLAQYWVADYHYQQRNYPEALRNFQMIPESRGFQAIFASTNGPRNRLPYQARMMAGRSAYAAQLWSDAGGEKGHFVLLINDPTCPEDIVAEAFFALGDTRIAEAAETRNAPSQKFREAREHFAKIPMLFATNQVAERLVYLAWGRIGDCSLQLAASDPRQYESATNAYWTVVTNALADVTARSMAEFGIGRALELQAAGTPAPESAVLLKTAAGHYYQVAFGANLTGAEQSDPFWVEKSAMAAARLAEEQKQWSVAINIYERLRNTLEPLRSGLKDRIERAREQLRTEKDGTGR